MHPRTIPGPTHNRRVEEIFGEALEIAFEDRDAFLARACAGDDALREEVEDLLAVAHAQTSGFLPTGDLPIPALAGETLAGLHPTLQGLSLAAGMRIDRYELLRSLGRGGMGTVFLAYDTRLHRRVAIKFLHAASLDMTERFLAEARATARCKHENIIIVHDVDTVDDHPYMVLEYLEGESLRQRLGRLAGSGETAAQASQASQAFGAPGQEPDREHLLERPAAEPSPREGHERDREGDETGALGAHPVGQRADEQAERRSAEGRHRDHEALLGGRQAEV